MLLINYLMNKKVKVTICHFDFFITSIQQENQSQ